MEGGENSVGSETSAPNYRIVCLSSRNEIGRLFGGLQVAECMQLQSQQNRTEEEDAVMNVPDAASTTMFCSLCGIAFDGREDQRGHYKLDWHRYNLKRRMMGEPPVTEATFDQIADGVSSISGSESESEEEATPPPTPIRRRHAKVFFQNEAGEILSLYRCILLGKNGPDDADFSKLACDVAQTNQQWALVMMGGGHFAAAVFCGADVLVHKTFHSYTVRAKQGGSQGARDGKSGTSHPKSAGASLRRYNEAALTQHVQEILEAWSAHIAKCDLIFVRAVGYNRSALFGGKNPPLNKQDPRIRTLPFPTKRATYSEIQRVYKLLSMVEVYGNSEDFAAMYPQSPHRPLRQHDVKPEKKSRQRSEAQKKNRSKARSSPSRQLPDYVTALAEEAPAIENGDDDVTLESVEVELDLVTSLEEFQVDFGKASPVRRRRKKSSSDKENPGEWKERAELRNKLYTACRVGDVNLLNENMAIALSLQTDQLDGAESSPHYPILNETFGESSLTMLHVAAKSGHPEVIMALMELGADPTIPDKRGRPPYCLSADRETRDSFRRFRGRNPDKFDYEKGQVPQGITKEMEEHRAERRKEQRKAKKDREKDRKKEDADKKRFLTLSDREKRAVAAESRFLKQLNDSGVSAPVLARCFQCGVDITGKVPFEYNDFRFCTVQCLKTHRQSHKS